jgi:hypothetical protein
MRSSEAGQGSGAGLIDALADVTDLALLPRGRT